MTDHEYRTIDAVNISTLKELWQRSPMHYQHRLITPRPDTPAMALGRAIHCAILEPQEYARRYATRPVALDGRTKEGKAWLAEHAHCEVLSSDYGETVRAVAAAVRAHPTVADWLAGPDCSVERIITWTDAETGVTCKGRLDLVSDSLLIGLKTAREIAPRRFAMQAAQLGYHLQWAFYYDGLAAIGAEPSSVYEIVVETIAPYDIAIYHVPPEVLAVGRDEYRAALARLVACRDRDHWPGQCPGITEFALPAWAASEQDWEVEP
jgi:exodeoxyribonuclease VIII